MKRRLLMLLLAAAVLAPLLAAPGTARAAHQFLWWDTIGNVTYGRFGPSSQITIRQGQIEFVNFCEVDGINDYIWPAADVYIMAAGDIGVGTELDDVNGVPNTIVAPSAGGMFIDELIGSNLGAGQYAVVYDECQDGDVDPGDFVLNPAFEVVGQQADIPGLPSFDDLKQMAAEKAQEHLDKIGEDIDDWFASRGRIPNTALRRLLYGRTDIPITNHPATIVRIQIINQAKHYLGIAADPPDPDFERVTALIPTAAIATPVDDPALLALAAVGGEAGTEAALAEALLRALERYQGAQAAQDGKWALVHARAIRDYALDLRTHIDESSASLAALGAAVAADPADVDAAAATAQAFIERVRAAGFSAEEIAEARSLGMSDAEISARSAEIVGYDFAGFSEAGLRAALADAIVANGGLQAALGNLAANMAPVIAQLEADGAVLDSAPAADAGGPYSGTEGTPLQLSGSATSPSPITSYAWDLDGDGAFDDATGAAPAVTFDRPFHGLVGLRVTNQAGMAHVDYARAEVGEVNRRPQISAAAPLAEPVAIDLGSGETFGVTAADPDGDAVEVEWFVDGAPAATGPTLTYSPPAEAIGVHRIEVEVRDGQPLGGAARKGWAVVVRAPDGDGDGYRANKDCDDSDPAVNPGMPEVVGNGRDDDCDDKTSDAGGAPVALFNPLGGGRNVALHDAGASIHSSSSQAGASYAAQYMINYALGDSGWRTASGKNADQWAIVALAGGKAYQIDRVKLMPGGGSEGVRSFSVAVSAGAADGPYTTVLTATAALNGPLQEYLLPEPVTAKYVRLTALTTQGAATAMAVKQFKVYTAQEGARAVTFDNLTVDSDDDIVSWEWDFGDGTTSTLREPSHTYSAEPRSYTVSLTATDAGGNTAAYSLPYRVLLPPAASFTVTPAAPNEGAKGTYTDTSADPDGAGMLASRTWTWGPSASSSTTQTPATDHLFPDSGSYVVKLQVIDLQEQVATVEQTITVANVPPTLTRLPDQTVVWGQELDMAGVVVNDVSFADRASLSCDWAFGDGATARVSRCNNGSVKVPYAYADPGAYSTSLTVRDQDGGTASASTAVTVTKRDSFVQVLSLRAVAGGQLEITAKAFDAYTWAALPGWEVSFTAGAASATATTGPDGAATATLARGDGVDTVGVAVAATSHYNASSMERLIEAPLGDVVFVVDESGSMGNDQEDLRRHLTSISMQLAEQVDFRIGLVGFGAARGTHGTTINGQGHIETALSNDVGAVGRSIAALAANGGYEAGFDGTRVSMADAMGFRPNAGACAVLITDDNADFGGDLPATRENAVAALRARGAIFLGVISTVPPSADQYGMGPGSLAVETGGQVWQIGEFRRNPQPILDAIMAKCLNHITRVDLSLSLTDGQERARIGAELTYTLTVTNASTGLARNVVLADALPAGTSFVSAGDGGALAGGKVAWPTFDLAAGQSVTRTLTVRLDGQLAAGTALVNTATVADDGQSGPDRTPANNTASDTTTLEAPLNTAPVAQDQAGTTPEDTAAQITLGASDAEGDALTYAIVAQPQHGALSGAAPDLIYTPAANYHGPDSLTFTVSDGSATSNLATVTIAVTPVNDAPLADAGADQTTVTNATVALDASGSSDLDGDALSFAWQQVSGPSVAITGAGTATPSFTPAAAGSYTFRLTVGDGQTSAEDSVTITAEPAPNTAPQAQDDAAATAENTAVLVDVLANDSDADGDALSVTAAGVAANGAVEVVAGGPDAGKLRYTPAAGFAGSDAFTYTVSDGKGGAAQASVSVTVTAVNDAPVVTAGADQATDEGGSVTVSATFTDAESAQQQYACTITWGDGQTSAGAVVAPDGGQPGSCTASHSYADDDPTGTPSDSYPVSITVSDSGAPAASASAGLSVAVRNLAPAIARIVAPVAPVSLGAAVEITVGLTDAGAADSHSCGVAWGDGTTATVAASGGSCVATRTYAGPGVYSVAVTVTDDDGGSATEHFQYAVIYDPSGGFVTGGGWITSPAGACRLTGVCGDTTGRANFGFVAKYRKGASVPEGQTEFQFKAAGLNFHSSRYDWLVVAGAKAQYKGEGTVNGRGGYGFMVAAVDGQLKGVAGPDTFRIKIWDLASGAIVYDNQMGAGDDAEPTTAIEGGNITIHK